MKEHDEKENRQLETLPIWQVTLFKI